MKIIRPFTGTGGVFFPIGQPPEGTCEFVTDRCMEHCYVKENRFPDFDEEIRVGESDIRFIYNFFMEEYALTVIERIFKELDGLQTNILHWFGSGDCKDSDLERISIIINLLDNSYPKTIQMGFTRNEKLWEKYKDIFILTIDNKEDIRDKTGLFSIPDYDEMVSVIYSTDYEIRGGLCGPTTCRDPNFTKLEHYINCKTCYRMKTGCFSKRFYV